MSTNVGVQEVPRTFEWRRLHSLMGLWFLIFLTEHLFTNSQVALFFGNDALWFVRSVNFLQNIPYLQVVECVLLGIPILYHAVWGIWYMVSSKPNSFPNDGSKPKMNYSRSHAYTWQRLSSWVILVGIILHVVQMRFIDYPYKYRFGNSAQFYVKLDVDPGLYAVADRLGVKLYDEKMIELEKNAFATMNHKILMVQERLDELKVSSEKAGEEFEYSSETDNAYQTLQRYELQREHIRGLESRKLSGTQVMAVSKNFGNLELLNVRQTFQSLTMCVLYSIFVLAAVFHGFNGLWTFLITWGVILSRKAHSTTSNFCTGLMFIVGLLGFMSIWGTFFLTMRG